MPLLQTDLDGQITLVDHADVTTAAETRITNSLTELIKKEISDVTDSFDTQLNAAVTSINKTISAQTTLDIESVNSRLNNIDKFVLSDPGKDCPTGYTHVKNRKECNQFQKYRRRTGHHWNQMLNASQHLITGCFMTNDTSNNLFFNGFDSTAKQQKGDMLVCKRSDQ